MNNIKALLLIIVSVFVANVSAIADAGVKPEVKISPALQKMKTLVGTWKGTASDMEDEKIEVQYKLSSGGSSVIETLAPGSSHEMTTVYYDEGGKLAMTHYCMLGNHPVMLLKKESPEELSFAVDTKDPINEEAHMHTLEIVFLGPDSIEHRWAMFNKGKEEHKTVFKVQRVS